MSCPRWLLSKKISSDSRTKILSARISASDQASSGAPPTITVTIKAFISSSMSPVISSGSPHPLMQKPMNSTHGTNSTNGVVLCWIGGIIWYLLSFGGGNCFNVRVILYQYWLKRGFRIFRNLFVRRNGFPRTKCLLLDLSLGFRFPSCNRWVDRLTIFGRIHYNNPSC